MIQPRQMTALALLAGVFIMEGFDIAAMSIAVPRLDEALGLEPASFGWVFTALLIGLGVGGALIAPLGDRFGRRALIVGGCLATGVFTLFTATATTVTEFLIWRLLTGLALGACLPNVSALSSELAPAGMRATVMAVVSAGIPVGLALAGISAPIIINGWDGIALMALSERFAVWISPLTFDGWGWQGLFFLPGSFAVVLAAALWVILDGGKPARADAAEAKSVAAKLPQFTLFARPWAFPFAVFSTMLALNALNLYLLNSWLPTVLPQAGLTMDVAAQVAGVANLAGLAIGIGASVLMDRWRKGLTLMLLFGSMAASFAVIGLTAPDTARWTLLLMVGVGGANAGGMVLPGLAAYLFPGRLLSSAVGMGVLVARLGAFAGPPLGAAMIAADVPARTFLGVATFPALACVAVALLVGRALLVKGREEAEA